VCEFTLAVHPVDGDVLTSGAARDVREVSGLAKGKLRPGICGIADHAFEDRRGLTGDFQLLQVEGHGEQRAFVHVDHVSAGHIAGMEAAAL